MGGQLLPSKNVVAGEKPRVRGIPSAPTSVAGAIGVTERGPIGQAVLCTSFKEFQNKFGGFTQNSDLALAAMGFFENGGSQLWIVRTVHHSDVAIQESQTALRASGYLNASGPPSPATVIGTFPAPFVLEDGDRLALSADDGAEEEIIVSGTAASVMSGGTGSFALVDGQILTLRIDGEYEQSILFSAGDFVDIANATSEEVATSINTQISGGKAWSDTEGGSVIASDTKGMSSRIQVTGGTANAALGFPTTEESGSGNVNTLAFVTISEIKVLLEAAISGVTVLEATSGFLEFRTTATGASASLQIGESTAAAFGLDTELHNGSDAGIVNLVRVEGKDPGAFGNRLEIEVRPATSGEANAFDLAVVDDDVYREVFPNLEMGPDRERYIDAVINDSRSGSLLIRTIDQLAGDSLLPDVQIVALADGDDGLTGLDDTDFIGSNTSKTGMHSLDQVQDLSLLLVPGRATAAVHNAMVRYCEVTRDGMVFAVLDPPENQSTTDIVNYVTSTAALQELTEHAAIYWPRVQVLNPARSVFGPDDKIVVPPSGIIAGVYARTDPARPGGINKGRMFGVLGFETNEVLEEAKWDLVYPTCISPLTTGPSLPRYIDGSRTLKASGNFPYVAERRGISCIERSRKQELQSTRHENNTKGLRPQVRRIITTFLILAAVPLRNWFIRLFGISSVAFSVMGFFSTGWNSVFLFFASGLSLSISIALLDPHLPVVAGMHALSSHRKRILHICLVVRSILVFVEAPAVHFLAALMFPFFGKIMEYVFSVFLDPDTPIVDNNIFMLLANFVERMTTQTIIPFFGTVEVPLTFIIAGTLAALFQFVLSFIEKHSVDEVSQIYKHHAYASAYKKERKILIMVATASGYALHPAVTLFSIGVFLLTFVSDARTGRMHSYDFETMSSIHGTFVSDILSRSLFYSSTLFVLASLTSADDSWVVTFICLQGFFVIPYLYAVKQSKVMDKIASNRGRSLLIICIGLESVFLFLIVTGKHPLVIIVQESFMFISETFFLLFPIVTNSFLAVLSINWILILLSRLLAVNPIGTMTVGEHLIMYLENQLKFVFMIIASSTFLAVYFGAVWQPTGDGWDLTVNNAFVSMFALIAMVHCSNVYSDAHAPLKTIEAGYSRRKIVKSLSKYHDRIEKCFKISDRIAVWGPITIGGITAYLIHDSVFVSVLPIVLIVCTMGFCIQKITLHKFAERNKVPHKEKWYVLL